METIMIKTENENIVVYLDNTKIYGYKFKSDDTVECIDNSIFKYFDFLKCSSNYSIIDSVSDYEVRIDNETGFKHYFKNGIDDINIFYLNNGEDATIYSGNNKNETMLAKKFRLERLRNNLVLMSIYAINILYYLPMNAVNYGNLVLNLCHVPLKYVESVSVEDLKNKIYSSNLTNEEKSYLYNENFFNDVLPYVNKTEWMKYSYDRSFDDINIISFSDEDLLYKDYRGYYNELEWHNLYVRNYDEVKNYDTLAHEFIHLCQCHLLEYNLIVEACAEIISYEYYQKTQMASYPKPVILVKKLMEIIGPEAVWNYNFTGDFSKIEEKVKPYLSDSEYNEFLNDLSFKNPDKNNENEPNFQSLDNILNILYQRIYNEDIKDNEIINLIEKDDGNLVRYYFNPRYINQDNSYYIGDTKQVIVNYSTEDALKKGLIRIVVEFYKSMNQEIGKKNYDKSDNIVAFDGISIIEDLIVEKKMNGDYIEELLTGHIGDYYFKNMTKEDLIKQGYIKDKVYYLRESEVLTYDDYISGKYNNNPQKIEILDENAEYLNGGIIQTTETRNVIIPLPTIKEGILNQNSKSMF